jgi:ribosomal protein S18 acetylase RimI-like enzyme
VVKIRNFSDSDAMSLAEISNEAFSDEITRGMSSFNPKRFIDLSEKEGVRVFVAEDKKNILGFLALTEGDIEVPAQIHLVAVAKEVRGRGIGKELIRKAVKHLEATDRRKIKLFARPWNVAMQKVCIDLGFVPEAYLKREYLDRDLILYSFFGSQ